MLSLWKLSAGDRPERYYLEQVAQGREDYYAGEGEAPEQWAGSGAGALCMGGRVEDEGLTRLLQARDPSSSGRRRIAAMTAAAEYNRDHYGQLAGEHAETLDRAVEQRRARLEANADQAATLLAAERAARADEHLALRDELTDRVPTSESLLGRDAEALDMTSRLPELVPEPPAVDVDLDLDFGP